MLKKVLGVLGSIIILLGLMCTPIFGNKPVLIVSGSMEPAIRTNALTIMHYCGVKDVEVGDIITYYHEGLDELVTHRVIEKYEDYVLTRGDANNMGDGVAITDDILQGKNFLVLNWTADLFSEVTHDRQYDMAEAVGAVCSFAVFGGLAIVFISLCCVWTRALYMAKKRRPYSKVDMTTMHTTIDRVGTLCDRANDMSWWRRAQLYIVFTTCYRQLKDVSDDVTKLGG